MDIRKWMMIFIITAVLGKFFAVGLSKFHFFSDVSNIEKIAEEKIAHIFTRPHEDPAPPPTLVYARAKQKPAPKPVLAHRTFPQVKPFNPVTPKKSPQVLAQEEKDRRKKRKKKLEKAADKKPELTVVTNDKQAAPQNTSFAQSPVISGLPLVPLTPITPNATVTPASTPKPGADMAMWLKLFTSQPTTATLTSFMNLYKSNQITASVYYTMMATLQKSTNPDLRKLAILGSSFEPNILAYTVLVHEKYSETVIDLQTLANTTLQKYKTTSSLSFLMQPLTAGDVFIKIEASDDVGAIAQILKTTPAALTAEVKVMLNHSVTLLTPLSKDTTSAALQASAAQTLIYIKAILGLTT